MIVRFGVDTPELTSGNWLYALGRIPSALQSGGSGTIEIDLSPVRWVGHLPLLALCLGIQEAEAASFDERRILMPTKPSVRAFLDRWGFYDFIWNRGFTWDLPADKQYSEALRNSRVLPIHGFEKAAEAEALRDVFRRADTDVRNLLTSGAFLTERQVNGLADLIVYELCENAIEHSETRRRAYIFGRVSREKDRARHVYETHAASWEREFFQGIQGEGMTELVIGDAGVGIVKSLGDQARLRNAGDTDEKIVKWAFEPFSTRKRESDLHTRGLWAVKNKVRELRGVLYVRTGTATGGVSLSWDFFNEPNRETPVVGHDEAAFPGTQVQILLPHRRVVRPSRFQLRRPQLTARGRALTQEAIQIPTRPEPLEIGQAMERLDERKVLFLDMSQMEDEAWDRPAIDQIGKAIYEGQGLRNARVWLLNPSEKALESLRVSEFVQRLWSEQALLLPVVDIKEIGRVPHIQYVISDAHIPRTPEAAARMDRGDTERSRTLLVDLVSRAATGGDAIELETVPNDLTSDEQSWLTNSLHKNISLVELSDDDAIRAAVDVESLARLAVDGVVRQTLEVAIENKKAEQERTERVLYKLPSNRYCKEYIDPRIFADLNPAARAAVEKWLEAAVHRTGATYALSYSFFAVDQLTRALRTEDIQDFAQLEHYAPEQVEQKLALIPREITVVLLIPISGSGRTIVTTAEALARRGNRLAVVCIIDTMTADERAALSEVVRPGDFHYLVHRPVAKWRYEQIPQELRDLPVAVIDPETLLPIIPIPVLAPILNDGEFWQLVADAKGLGGPVTYKGIAYTTLFWVQNLLRHPPILAHIVDDLKKCFSLAGAAIRPDIICLPRETADARVAELKKTLEVEFPSAQVILEEELRAGGHSFEGKYVAIVVAAASSGGGVARLLTFFRTARRIHLSIFINRVPNGIASSFAPPGGKVTITSFQRVFTGSPALRVGNAQSIALPALRDYRPSCVSNRLLLFVDSLQKEIHDAMRSAENPQELATVSRPIQRPEHLRFEPRHSYTLLTPAGVEDLQRLVSRCGREDRDWLYAVLEEAAARAEVADRQQEVAAPDWREFYIEQLQKLYVLAPSGDDTTARGVILEALLLDRWIWHKRPELKEGKTEIPGERAQALSRDLLMDMDRSDNAHFRALAIRAIAKIDRPLLIDRVGQILRIALRDRITELTLSLELTKILDDDVIPTQLLEQLTHIFSDRARHPARRQDQFDVALANLFEDLGLYATRENTVEFLPWERMVNVLQNEPPDHDRTVRALIRCMRGRFGPQARFLYYREIDKGLYAYADAWPRKRITEGRTIPEANLKALKLLGTAEVFYTPHLRQDRSTPAVKAFLNSLSVRERRKLLDWGIALYRIRAEGRTGFLRVWQQVGPDSELNPEAVMALRDAIPKVTDLIDRKGSAVSAVGEWQYQQILTTLRTPEEKSLTATLAAFTDRVRLLLGGDIATLLELDEERDVWCRHHVSGPFRVRAGPEFDPKASPKRKFLTVEVATNRTPRMFRDIRSAEAEGFHHPPAAPWAQAWLAFPLLDGDRKCTAVIHVWHHTPGWFEPLRTDDLINALSRLGGSLQALHAAYSKATVPQFDFTQNELERLTRRLINLLLTAEGLASGAPQERADEMKNLTNVIGQAQTDLARLLEIVDRPATEPAEGSLADMVSNAVAEANRRYAERRFDLVEMDNNLPPIRILPTIMGRAIEELLRNAKRHTEPGQRVEVSLNHDGGDPGNIRLEVRNRGYGVPQDLKEEIFARSGLLLVKTAAERHGGSVEELGIPGESAVFRMTLPVQTP